jgi:riboflavin-specific deaminase-like protein
MEWLFPHEDGSPAPSEVYADLQFPDPPAERPYVFLNFVTTLDGQSTVGTTGVAGIGSKQDHELMAYLRACADGLLHGAGTVRADNFPPRVPARLEPWRVERGMAPQPLGAVVTRSGNLAPDNRYFTARPPMVYTTRQAFASATSRLGDRAAVVATGEFDVDLGLALRDLRARHAIRTLLCEGGPVLARDLLGGGYLDEIFLTLAPKLGSDRAALHLLEGPPFLGDALPALDLIHVMRNDSELFLRYRIRR